MKLNGKPNILIVSPYFAPVQLIASLRMTSLAGFLAEQDANVTVLCSKGSYYKRTYGAIDIPHGVEVIQADIFPEGPIAIIKYYKALKALLSTRAFDVCIFTMGPFWANFYLPKLKKKFDMKVIIDYRDVWIEHEVKPKTPAHKLKILLYKKCFCKFIEKRSFACADRIVAVSKQAYDYLTEDYKSIKNKFVIIENGYAGTAKETRISEQIGSERCFKIGLAGKYVMYDPAGSQNLIEAINTLNRKGIETYLYHIGPVDGDVFDKNNKTYLSNVKEVGPLLHDECLGVLDKMDCCAAVYETKYVGTKIYDYIKLKKPVIALAPRGGDIPRIIEEYGNGYVCNTREEIAEALLKVYAGNIGTVNEESVDYHSRDNSNRRYYSLICSMID